MSARAALTSSLGAAVLLTGCVADVPLGRTVYATDVPRGYQSHDARDAAVVLAGLDGSGVTALAEPEADALAAELVAYAERTWCEAPSSASVSRLGFRSGIYDHHLAVAVWRFTRAMGAITPHLEKWAGLPVGAEDEHCSVAVGAARHSSHGVTTVALVRATRCVTLDSPLPRVVSVGQRIELAGHMAEGYRPTEIAITLPSGRVRTATLQARGAQFTFGHTFRSPGRYVLELCGENAVSGPTPLMKAELLVGVAPEDPRPTCEPLDPEDIDTARYGVLALVNATRRALDLPEVRLEPRLTLAAYDHSREMRDLRYWGHWSPSGSRPDQRARDAGAPVVLVEENLASAPSAHDLHEGLMESPAHRSSILDPDVTHVGIGIVEVEGGLYMTELFGRINPRLVVERDRRLVLDSVASRVGHAPTTDPSLEAIAQEWAERFFARDDARTEDAVCEEVLRATRDLPHAHGACQTFRFPSLDLVATMSIFRGPYDRFGIGLAQGMRRDGPPGETIVVVVALRSP